MSGHSKWANIKTRKGAQDKKRSEVFTRVAKDILVAIRMGGGNTDLEVNNKLKTAIEKARQVNMPKDNIERLLNRFEERKNNLISILLEGYGPAAIPVMVEAETDNKNRTLSEIKLIFKNNGGNLGESNSVAFQFERVGEIFVKNLTDSEQLKLIDLGALDFEENLILVAFVDLGNFVKKVESLGLGVEDYKGVYRAISPKDIGDGDKEKVLDLIDELENHEDVLGVFVGARL